MLPRCLHQLVRQRLVIVALLYRLALRFLELLDRKPDPLHLGHASEPPLKSASDRFYSFLATDRFQEAREIPRHLANTTKLKHLIPVDNQAPRF